MKKESHSNLINGKWSQKGSSFVSVNPSDTTDTIGSFHEATEEECIQAINSAKTAFKLWSQSELEERKKYWIKLAMN